LGDIPKIHLKFGAKFKKQGGGGEQLGKKAAVGRKIHQNWRRKPNKIHQILGEIGGGNSKPTNRITNKKSIKLAAKNNIKTHKI
jgi:hypothetical protein